MEDMVTVYVVGGPAGTGKTTIGEIISKKLSCPYVEGDSLHSEANINKMSQGIPLTDEDRWGWLERVSSISSKKASESPSQTVVVSCSMLKKVYRNYIKGKANLTPTPTFRFIFLFTSYEELLSRVSHRSGHYMKSDMVKSQYDIMEIPKDDELLENGGEAISIDTSKIIPEQVLDIVFKKST